MLANHCSMFGFARCTCSAIEDECPPPTAFNREGRVWFRVYGAVGALPGLGFALRNRLLSMLWGTDVAVGVAGAQHGEHRYGRCVSDKHERYISRPPCADDISARWRLNERHCERDACDEDEILKENRDVRVARVSLEAACQSRCDGGNRNQKLYEHIRAECCAGGRIPYGEGEWGTRQ